MDRRARRILVSESAVNNVCGKNPVDKKTCRRFARKTPLASEDRVYLDVKERETSVVFRSRKTVKRNLEKQRLNRDSLNKIIRVLFGEIVTTNPRWTERE